MKRVLFLFIILIVCASAFAIYSRAFEREPRYNHQIKGTVYQWVETTTPGSRAAWTTELQPAVGIKLYVRAQIDGYRGKMPIIDSFFTDSLGNFQIFLENGKYHIIEAWKTLPLVFPNNSENLEWDTACVRKKYLEPDEAIDVNGEMDSVKVLLFPTSNEFNPCVKRK